MRLRNGRSTTCGSAHAHARRDRARTRARYARTRRHGDRSCDDLERAVPLSVNPETTTTMNDNLGIVQADSVRADFHTDGAHFTVSRVVLARPMFVPSHARRASCTRADACAVWQCTLSTNHHCGYNHCASLPRSSRFPIRRCALHCVTCGSGMPYVCALPCLASKLYPSGCLCCMAVPIVPYSTA
jgi:hypothetical protein